MTDQPRSLALLRAANPVSVDPAAVRSPQARGLLDQITALPRDRGRSGRRSLSDLGLRSRIAFGSVGVAAAAAVIVAAFSGSAAAPAFAGWTAKPAAALGRQVTTATRKCRLARPVLAETRGPYTAAVFASRYGGTACIVGPGMSFEGSVGGVRAPDNRFKPDQIGMAVNTSADDTGHGFTVLTGRVGAAVRSVVIHRSDHINVIASINGGWYLAWWPANSHATYATVTTATGSQRVALPSLATTKPACHLRLPPGFPGHGHQFSGSCGAAGGISFPNSVGHSNGPGSDGMPGPPLIGNPIGEPYQGTWLFNVWNDATSVRVCFHPPANLNAAMRKNGPTGPCSPATLLTRLPRGYPVQKNLLEIFPRGVWEIKLPAGPGTHGPLRFLVIARSPQGYGPRSELTVTR